MQSPTPTSLARYELVCLKEFCSFRYHLCFLYFCPPNNSLQSNLFFLLWVSNIGGAPYEIQSQYPISLLFIYILYLPPGGTFLVLPASNTNQNPFFSTLGYTNLRWAKSFIPVNDSIPVRLPNGTGFILCSTFTVLHDLNTQRTQISYKLTSVSKSLCSELLCYEWIYVYLFKQPQQAACDCRGYTSNQVASA